MRQHLRRAVPSLLVIVLLTATVLARQEKNISVNLFSLGFNYWSPKPADVKAGKPLKSTIPDKIQILNGAHVRIEGFMIPYDQSSARVTEFMLVGSYDSCGFGDLPASLSDFVYVTLPKGRTTFYTVNPIVVTGLFEVGEEFDKDGYVTSIYRLAAEGVSGG
jgi:hypothetical protein